MRVSQFAILAALFAARVMSQQERPQEQSTPPAKPPESADQTKKDNSDPMFKGMEYRSIGPFRGGRSLTVAGIPGDPSTYYFGGVGGGIWKSTDGANTWRPIFDK